MQALGYVPNQLARQLRTGERTAIGMVVLSFSNPFFAELAHASEEAAESAGFSLTLGSSNESIDRQERYLRLFARQRVAGVLVAPVDGASAGMRALNDRGTPVVLFDDIGPSVSDLPTIVLDGRTGGMLAVRHLIETGRRRLAFLGGPLRLVDQRWIGAMQAAAEEPHVSIRHIDTPDTTLESGRAFAAQLEAMDPRERPDGVFAANDLLALGLQQALLASREIDVSRDLGVVGFDDIPFAATASIPLTTVRQPVEDLAAAAIGLLSRPAEDGSRQLRLQPELVVRESTPLAV